MLSMWKLTLGYYNMWLVGEKKKRKKPFVMMRVTSTFMCLLESLEVVELSPLVELSCK
jgi:hypothetical protein